MLKDLIQTTEPKIYISVFDDYADCSDDETPMRYCAIQWVWQDSADNWAWLETMGLINEPDDVGKTMTTIMHRLATARIEYA